MRRAKNKPAFEQLLSDVAVFVKSRGFSMMCLAVAIKADSEIQVTEGWNPAFITKCKEDSSFFRVGQSACERLNRKLASLPEKQLFPPKGTEETNHD